MQPEPQKYKTVMRFSMTGRVRTQRSRLGNGFAYTMIAGLFLLFLYLAHHDLSDLMALQSGGRTTYAQITNKRISSGKSTSYYLYYTFMAGELAVQSRASVSTSRYNAARLGDPLLVTYLPSNPSVNRVGIVDEARIHSAQLGWLIVLSLFVVLIAVIALAGFYQSRARKAVVRRIL